MTYAPLLVLAVGNPSRGDDALGPMLLQRLAQCGVEADGGVELLADFQLQIEHALDLQGRSAVLFVDAARPGVLAPGTGVSLSPLYPAPCRTPLSHALPPQAVMGVAAQMLAQVPPASLLAIEGARFELGQGLSRPARRHLVRAFALAMDWINAHGGKAAAPAPSVSWTR